MMKHSRPLASLLILLLIAPIFSGCTDFFDDNAPPTVNMSIDPSGTLKAEQSVTFSAVGTSDVDGDSLTFTLELTNKEDGSSADFVTMSSNGRIQGTPREDDIGEYSARIIVSDGTDAAIQSFDLIVNE